MQKTLEAISNAKTNKMKNNSKIYTKRREPFLNVKDAWIYSLTYLLKRSPIYK